MNVAKAEKIVWIAYVEKKRGIVLKATKNRQSAGHKPLWFESTETTHSYSYKPPKELMAIHV